MIFVDTSFWVAASMRRDERHGMAAGLLERHADAPLFTSNLVQGETWTFLRRRAGHGAAVDFLSRIERSPRIRLVPVTGPLEAEAWRWLRRHDERGYSFVDATSFALMRSVRAREALAFDGDFSAAGFAELR
ncbi:MAG: type II toxin-antitoxin system VapC family toxin [Acidimicrobiales bacterium]